AAPRPRDRSGARARRAGREAVPLLRRARHLRPRRRSALSEPRLPDLRVGHPLGGRDARAAADRRGTRLRLLRRRSRRAADAEHDTIAGHEGLLDRTILVDGFSKTFAMTGWRLGYAALPSELVEPVTRLLINSVSCTAPAVQLAGVAALQGPRTEVEAMLAEFRRRRDVVVPGLNALPGVSCVTPRGAFYAFPNITATGLSAKDLA